MNECIKLLTEKLIEYQKALKKSNQSVSIGEITKELHSIHVKNLVPKIALFEQSIKILTDKL